ncbi:hypothetical protein OQZ33_02615 [Pedobacter sp. MC2016-05]|uniref:hypothetical protein n=1 Tax=Pedobacter sp. MC2016-05 TaxID=2994474 RepID=UPI00224628C9|nr:hypothetical protein [Pedobacter sp. MC2016-05]MCX2473217.1 hypothetical protein [Pedobacter sp. MC2016-05]
MPKLISKQITSFEKKMKGKRILFIGVKFYHYTEEIKKKMESLGAEVTFFYERDTSLKYALAKNFFPGYANKIQDLHYMEVIRKIGPLAFDYLFVIGGYKMEEWFVKTLKERLPDLKTILYQWDSIYNWECDYRHMIPWFDVTKTFDYKDSEMLHLENLPTFHTDEFKVVSTEIPKFDLFFVGGYSHVRYEFVKKLIRYCKTHGIKLKVHLAISIKYFLKEKLSGKALDASILSFSKLDQQEYYRLFKQANIIIDYTNPAQTGITTRSLDALGAGKKLLTTNEYIVREPGFNPEQIRIFDPHKIHIDKDFLAPKTFAHQNYSIEKWLDAVFD